MDLHQLVKDLEEIKVCIEDNQIEKAEDLLGFVIGEIAIAAQQKRAADSAKAARLARQKKAKSKKVAPAKSG